MIVKFEVDSENLDELRLVYDLICRMKSGLEAKCSVNFFDYVDCIGSAKEIALYNAVYPNGYSRGGYQKVAGIKKLRELCPHHNLSLSQAKLIVDNYISHCEGK